MELAQKLARKEAIPRQIHMNDAVYREWDDLSGLSPRGY
jgi:hypothetical protein